MPWQNQSGGPWGGGGQGPWGGRGGGGGGGSGGPPPDLEEMLRKGQDKLRQLFPSGGAPARVVPIVLAVVVGLWLATGFYRVHPDEQGVELVFGKWNGQTTLAGLHWNWPTPIGEVHTPQVERSNRVSIGYRGAPEVVRGPMELGRRPDTVRGVPEESLMLTSDENIVDLEVTVLWKIKDAGQFLFQIRDPEATVKVAAESVMREVVGQTPFDLAVTVGREQIEQRATEILQRILDNYNAGVLVEAIQLQKSDPPTEVIDAFNDVQRARQDRDRLRHEAEAYANSIIPDARGEAEQIIRAAEAYKERLLREADGEAQRFVAVYDAYRTAPDVTLRRMYLETVSRILSSSEKVIIDHGVAGAGPGVVPYLPLPELRKRQQERADPDGVTAAQPQQRAQQPVQRQQPAQRTPSVQR